MAGARKKHGYNKGRWQVQRERAHIASPYAPAPFHEAEHVGTVIPGLMKKLGLEDRHWLGQLEQEWSDLVGAAVAKHTRPGRLEGKELTVFVDSSVWLNELSRYGKGQVLANLKRRFGAQRIREIRLNLDPGSAQQPSSQ